MKYKLTLSIVVLLLSINCFSQIGPYDKPAYSTYTPILTPVQTQEKPVMEVTYKNATLVNTITNTIEGKAEGQFYIAFFTHVIYYVEGGVTDKYRIIDSRDDNQGVTMVLRNENNQRCGSRFEKDKLIITNTVTHKSILLSNPYYH